MIIDLIENLKKYSTIPHVDTICDFLKDTNIIALEEGDHAIKGQDLYVKVLNYIPNQTEKNNFETHEFYTDVQVLIEGTELMQTAPPDCVQEKLGCEMGGDFKFFYADEYISDFVVRKGQFVVFFPQEAHRPGCRYQNLTSPVRKLVFKTKNMSASHNE